MITRPPVRFCVSNNLLKFLNDFFTFFCLNFYNLRFICDFKVCLIGCRLKVGQYPLGKPLQNTPDHTPGQIPSRSVPLVNTSELFPRANTLDITTHKTKFTNALQYNLFVFLFWSNVL